MNGRSVFVITQLVSLVIAGQSLAPLSALAFDLDLGNGNEIHVTRGPSGHHTWELRDGMGDQIGGTHTPDGDRHTDVHVLGNDVVVRKGMLGDKDYAVNTMTGQNVQGECQFAGGPHHTNVDVGGAHITGAQPAYGIGNGPGSVNGPSGSNGSNGSSQHFFGDKTRPAAGATWQNDCPQAGQAAGDKSSEIVNKEPSSKQIEQANKTRPEKTLP